MTIEDVVKQCFGTQLAMAKYLGVSTAAVNFWVQKNELPLRRAIQIEHYTKGNIKASDLVGAKGKEMFNLMKG